MLSKKSLKYPVITIKCFVVASVLLLTHGNLPLRLNPKALYETFAGI